MSRRKTMLTPEAAEAQYAEARLMLVSASVWKDETYLKMLADSDESDVQTFLELRASLHRYYRSTDNLDPALVNAALASNPHLSKPDTHYSIN